jgi:hypothetical protein
MSDECQEKQPVEIVRECDQPKRPIGFASAKDQVVRKYIVDKYVEATGHGYGSSEVSQEEADEQAIERAVEHGETQIKVIYPDNFALIAPKNSGWQGTIEKKPWHYRVTAAIPHLDTIEPLRVCIECLRSQTERPYIMVIDTGSSRQVRDELEAMRAEDVEISFIARHAYRHASEPVTSALDVAQAICTTEFIFHTHSDCFLRRHNFLEYLTNTCSARNPVVGYRMSPRDWATDRWEWMVSHTTTMLHMPTMNRIGAQWSMRRMHEEYGYPYELESKCGGWPDTETGFNHILRDNGIAPLFIGFDRNHQREVDHNRDHVRSYAGSSIYSENYHQKCAPWMVAAMKEAKARLSLTRV